MTALPQELESTAPLLRSPQRTDTATTAELALSEYDPYFYDHPLDHVPVMALVCALFDLARLTRPDDDPARLALRMEFPSFCEPNADVALVHSGTALLAEQDGEVVCSGELNRTALPLHTVRPAPPSLRRLPADPVLVHRCDLENVLVTGMADTGDGRVVAFREPAPGHRLGVAPDAPARPEALLDAARQFATMLCHTEFRRPEDTRLVLLGLEADLVVGVPGGVHLRWSRTRPPRGRSRVEFTVTTSDGAALGRIGLDCFAASPAAYRRMRGEARSA
ncbi:AfsA-related hotdog domain-containing protein [Actinokineospora sp. UTMC 2448]|uniref:AfsA-related hotdog domain-containing protein n=1 Tax=Actinokineospora sp. UTMC 2448 TaxID=2268449 RepID=UPI0021640599|nr:AfsA-related hotdog domain-containing protein [Actinokineospora sp. UTMC 2448]UVS79711.1 A-factor biosynthesis hotdog domain protein [Actinokineospora sp. UTMC 2448]